MLSPYYNNTCDVFGSMHLLCIIYIYATSQRKRRRVESDKCPKELNSFSLSREDVVGLPSHLIFLIIIRGNSSRNDSLAIQYTTCNAFSRAIEKGAAKVETRPSGGRTKITDIACGNKPPLECRRWLRSAFSR